MLGIIVAMKNEADCLLSQSKIIRRSRQFGKEICRAEFDGNEFILVLSGVGKDNAASAAMLALTLGADTLLNFGVAGGLTHDKKIGMVFQIRKAVEIDFDLSAINHTPVGTHNERSDPFFVLPYSNASPFLSGIVATADYFACGDDDRQLLEAFGADIREMEGAAVAHIASNAEVPCYMFKAISDNAGENSPNEYAVNCALALRHLSENMKNIFAEALHG